MSFLKRLGKALAGAPQPDRNAHWVYVRCRRCGEALASRVNLGSELSVEYGGSGQPSGYHTRKVLVGSGKKRCYQSIEVSLRFDAHRKLVDREIVGGEFITAEEFKAEQAEA